MQESRDWESRGHCTGILIDSIFDCTKGRLNRSRSRLLNALNPFNYVSMGTVLNLDRFSGDFRYKILKPMFINFLMATNVALWRPHPDQQPGDLFRDRPCCGQADRSGLPV